MGRLNYEISQLALKCGFETNGATVQEGGGGGGVHAR